MNWNLEGMEVWGTYLNEFPVHGRVTLSRVAFGGRVLHTVKLYDRVNVYGREADVVIIEHMDVERVKDITKETV